MCALKVFYEPEQLTSQPPSQGGNMGAAGRFIVLLSWWFLAAVSPGTVLSNSMRPPWRKPHAFTENNQDYSQAGMFGVLLAWGPEGQPFLLILAERIS